MPVVPIVMGGGNFSRDLPPKSYIDVNDFETVKALADYLKYLINNPVNIFQFFKHLNDIRINFSKSC